MTTFEKRLRAMDDAALRAGAEELLALLTEAEGVRRGRRSSVEDGAHKRPGPAARAYAPGTGDVSPARGGGGKTEAVSAISAFASDGAIPETARVRRDHPETDGGGPAAEEDMRENPALPEPAFLEVPDREDRKKRETQKDREGREDPDDPEDREDPDDLGDPASRDAPEGRENRDAQARALRTEDGEAVGRAQAQALEKRLESVSARRRGSALQSGEDGAYTAAFRGPERQYEGAVGARGSEMRRISDYFRRDSRRYDTGFTRY